MKNKLYTITCCLLLCCGLSVLGQEKKEANRKPIERDSTEYYSNPILSTSMPDPTIIKTDDGFYLYATENIRNVPIMHSKNLIDWTFVGTAFTDSTRPNFEPKGGIWAPDINKIENKYVLYYAMSVWGGEETCGIGVATSDKPQGPFKDHGKLFRSNEIGVTNSIDPCFFEENGRKYLFWGSFRGIYAIELSNDGLSIKPNTTKLQVAGTDFEACSIEKVGRYYYLFASIGTCCEGVNSSYQTVVGRSLKLLGPYINKANIPMLENGYELIISRSKDFVGNGHNSRLVEDKMGNYWTFYHGVSINQPDGRMLLLDQIKWGKDDWPYIDGGSPSSKALKPKW